MTKGFIFDYGGTLDTCGKHWGKVLWHAYEQLQVPVSDEQFREAYIHAERTLGKNHIIQPDFTFRQTLEKKLEIELEHLSMLASRSMTQYLEPLLNDLYTHVVKTTQHSVEVLRELQESCGLPMVLVSNFYGNIQVVLREFGFDGLFDEVVESAVVGIRKPDARIFTLGVEALKLKPSDASGVIVVGDSISKDIIPAQKIGCQTVWLKGEGWFGEEQDETVPDNIITDLSQLLLCVKSDNKQKS